MKICSRFRLLIQVAMLAVISMIATTTAQAADSFLPPHIYKEVSFQDIHNLWCEEPIILCSQYGLLKGTSNTEFSPDQPLTYAQITVIAARLQDILDGGDGTIPSPSKGMPWYLPAQHRLAETGSLPEHLKWQLENQPSASCRRNIFVETLTAVLEKTSAVLSSINQVPILPDCEDPAVLSFYQAGILGGTDRWGSFQGTEILNRGQAAAILSRIIIPERRLHISLEHFDLCKDILHLPPNQVFFTVNDKKYTAQQYAVVITAAIACPPIHSEPVPAQIIQDLYPFCYNYIAVETLAEKQNIGLTVEESNDITLKAAARSGYRGLPAVYWVWQERILLLEEKLERYYQKCGVDFHTIREETAGILQNAAIIAPELYALDLAAIHERMKNYPESYWH